MSKKQKKQGGPLCFYSYSSYTYLNIDTTIPCTVLRIFLQRCITTVYDTLSTDPLYDFSLYPTFWFEFLWCVCIIANPHQHHQVTCKVIKVIIRAMQHFLISQDFLILLSLMYFHLRATFSMNITRHIFLVLIFLVYEVWLFS